MKSLLKKLLLLCTLLVFIGAVPLAAYAKDYTPGQVKGLKATAGESVVTLKWKKVSGAKGYTIYRINGNGQQTKVAKTSKLKYKIKGLKNAVPYTFAVAAYRKVKSTTYEGASAKVTATPQVTRPATPKFYVTAAGSSSATLQWKSSKKATGYEVFQKNSSGEYVSVGTVTGTSTVIRNLTNGTTYNFKVRAFRKVDGVISYSGLSYEATVKPANVANEVKSVKTMTYRARVKRTVNAKLSNNSGQKVTVKGGTAVTVTYWSHKNCTVKLSNGKNVLIKNSNLTFTGCNYSTKTDYSTSTKENYVNYKGYSSKSKYLIWVSLYHQKTYIFKGSAGNWKLAKTFRCSSGKAATATPRGLFNLYKKSRRMQFDAGSYADYACYFNGSALHSWVKLGSPSYGYTGQKYDGYPSKLGHPASHGCVRYKDADIYYIYKNVPIGTTIIMY